MNDRKAPTLETSGSLVPELEGAPHSSGHDRHPSSVQRPKEGGSTHQN